MNEKQRKLCNRIYAICNEEIYQISDVIAALDVCLNVYRKGTKRRKPESKTKMKTIKVEISVAEDDFCLSDLKEVLGDGFHNVGNHTLVDVKEL